jgi:putative oxidoreductase
LGLLTRAGALFLAITMLVAMFGVHWSGGFFLSSRGIEYTVALLGMSLALLIAGGGRLSIDERLQAPPRRRW